MPIDFIDEFLFIFEILLAIILFIVFYMFCPRLFKKPDISPFTGKIIAHRGFHNNIDVPENSMKAFSLAVEKGYGIELDLHLTKDRIPVVFHDNTLLRMCNTDVKISELTYDELRKFRLLETEEIIPSFSDVLEIVSEKVPLIIELKIDGRSLDLSQVAATSLENYKGIYCIESFNPILLRKFAKISPTTIRGILSTKFKPDGEINKCFYALLQSLLFNFLCRPDFIAYEYKYGNYLPVVLCRKLGIATFAWTIRNKEDYKNAKKYFDTFICENIDEL